MPPGIDCDLKQGVQGQEDNIGTKMKKARESQSEANQTVRGDRELPMSNVWAVELCVTCPPRPRRPSKPHANLGCGSSPRLTF